MPLLTEYECDITGEKGINAGDFTVFTIQRGNELTVTVVSNNWLEDEMESNEALSSIVLPD